MRGASRADVFEPLPVSMPDIRFFRGKYPKCGMETGRALKLAPAGPFAPDESWAYVVCRCGAGTEAGEEGTR